MACSFRRTWPKVALWAYLSRARVYVGPISPLNSAPFVSRAGILARSTGLATRRAESLGARSRDLGGRRLHHKDAAARAQKTSSLRSDSRPLPAASCSDAAMCNLQVEARVCIRATSWIWIWFGCSEAALIRATRDFAGNRLARNCKIALIARATTITRDRKSFRAS